MTMTTNPSEDSLTVDGHPFTDVELDVKPHLQDAQQQQDEEEARPPEQPEGQEAEQQSQAGQSPKTVLPGGYVVDESKPMGKVIKKVMRAGQRCVDGMEFIGGVVAHVLGITQSRYQWVIDTMNEDDVQAAQEDYAQSRNQRVLLFDEIRQREEEEVAATVEVQQGQQQQQGQQEGGGSLTKAGGGSIEMVAAPSAAGEDLEAN